MAKTTRQTRGKRSGVSIVFGFSTTLAKLLDSSACTAIYNKFRVFVRNFQQSSNLRSPLTAPRRARKLYTEWQSCAKIAIKFPRRTSHQRHAYWSWRARGGGGGVWSAMQVGLNCSTEQGQKQKKYGVLHNRGHTLQQRHQHCRETIHTHPRPHTDYSHIPSGSCPALCGTWRGAPARARCSCCASS